MLDALEDLASRLGEEESQLALRVLGDIRYAFARVTHSEQ